MVSYEKQRITLPGVNNARQLGGYTGADGRKVKDNVLIRTGTLFKAPGETVKLLEEIYRVCDIIDLRMDQEAQYMPDPEVSGAVYHHLSVMNDYPISEEDMETFLKIMQIKDSGERYKMIYDSGIKVDMRDIYKMIAFSESGVAGYSEFFRILLNKPEDRAVLFHCTQGKDRTGIGAVLALLALGVDRETAVSDYLLTNEACAWMLDDVREAVKRKTDDADILRCAEMFECVEREYIGAVLDKIDEEYGGAIRYISETLGVGEDGIGKLRGMYLE